MEFHTYCQITFSAKFYLLLLALFVLSAHLLIAWTPLSIIFFLFDKQKDLIICVFICHPLSINKVSLLSFVLTGVGSSASENLFMCLSVFPLLYKNSVQKFWMLPFSPLCSFTTPFYSSTSCFCYHSKAGDLQPCALF